MSHEPLSPVNLDKPFRDLESLADTMSRLTGRDREQSYRKLIERIADGVCHPVRDPAMPSGISVVPIFLAAEDEEVDG